VAYTQILIDTNSYLRLAQNIHPLLGEPFGKKEYALYILQEVNVELKVSSRLKNCFYWAEESEWKENRKKFLRLNKKKKSAIEATFEFMWDYVKNEILPVKGKGPSDVDTLFIATAYEIGIQVVTDDQDMIELAESYEVPYLTSLKLLKLMLDNDHIALEKIEAIVKQWEYENDTPYRNWKKEYRSLFGKTPPKM
jgi:hypothetical protein